MNDQWFVLQKFLATPAVFLLLFMWAMVTFVAVKTSNIKPLRWVFGLTVMLMVFRVLPL
jgi:hypothetical protein